MKRVSIAHRQSLCFLYCFFAACPSGATIWTGKRLTTTSGASAAPAVAVDSGDNIYVVYQDDTPGNNEIYFKKSTDGGSVWTDQAPDLQPAAHLRRLRLLLTAAVTSMWSIRTTLPGNNEIYFKKSTDGGSVWTTKQTDLNQRRIC